MHLRTYEAEVLVGQPAKNLLYSRNARSVVGHQLLLGMQYDSPEATALRTPDTALRTPGTQSVRLPCPVRDPEIMGARDRAIPVLAKFCGSTFTWQHCQQKQIIVRRRSARHVSCVVRTRDEAR